MAVTFICSKPACNLDWQRARMSWARMLRRGRSARLGETVLECWQAKVLEDDQVGPYSHALSALEVRIGLIKMR